MMEAIGKKLKLGFNFCVKQTDKKASKKKNGDLNYLR